jgi:hypothetical protein
MTAPDAAETTEPAGARDVPKPMRDYAPPEDRPPLLS